MDIIQTASDMIKIRTETGNIAEINKCIQYIADIFKGTEAKVKIFRDVENAPVVFISNTESRNFDVLVLGHIDVVPATDEMFSPYVKDGKMYGRGTLDMKSFAAVAFNSMLYVLKNKLNLKFGIILSSDEEKGSKGTEKFLENYHDLKADIVLDNDVGGDIYKIINKCKNPVFVKLIAKGKEAHGSTPWLGKDANEMLMQTCNNLRKIYPYFSTETGTPENTWIDTLHFATINGGKVSNIISDYAEALLDFRLTEDSSVENLCKNIENCLADGVEYTIVSSSNPVVMSPDDEDILAYKNIAEETLNHNIEFQQIGGATDARAFAVRGSTVIMHSGSGDGMHAKDEFVETDSVLKLAEIQLKFLQRLADKK